MGGLLVQQLWFLSLAKKEFRAKNSNTRGSLFSTEAEEVSQLACIDSGNKLQRQKEGPWRQVQGVSPGLADPLVVSLQGTFRDWSKEKQRCMSEERGLEWHRYAPRRAHTESFAIRVLISFLETEILRELSREDLNKIFISLKVWPFRVVSPLSDWHYGRRPLAIAHGHSVSHGIIFSHFTAFREPGTETQLRTRY